MGFDLRTHVRDPKTGQLTKLQPYTIKFVGNTCTYFRDGVAYSPDGKEIVTKESIRRKEAKRKADALFQAEQESKIATKKAQNAEEDMLLLEVLKEEDEKSLKELTGKSDKESKELKESLKEKIKTAVEDIKEAGVRFKELSEISDEKKKVFSELPRPKEESQE